MPKYLDELPVRGVKSRVSHHVSPSAHTQRKSHEGFDNDLSTMNALLEIVLGREPERYFRKGDLGRLLMSAARRKAIA